MPPLLRKYVSPAAETGAPAEVPEEEHPSPAPAAVTPAVFGAKPGAVAQRGRVVPAPGGLAASTARENVARAGATPGGETGNVYVIVGGQPSPAPEGQPRREAVAPVPVAAPAQVPSALNDAALAQQWRLMNARQTSKVSPPACVEVETCQGGGGGHCLWSWLVFIIIAGVLIYLAWRIWVGASHCQSHAFAPVRGAACGPPGGGRRTVFTAPRRAVGRWC